jgi:hypothetical protein
VIFVILQVSMAKQKKKRNKVYTGQDAAVNRPSVTRISAANRNKAQQWWFEKKRIAKPVLIGVAVAIIVIWLLIELVRIVSGA